MSIEQKIIISLVIGGLVGIVFGLVYKAEGFSQTEQAMMCYGTAWLSTLFIQGFWILARFW